MRDARRRQSASVAMIDFTSARSSTSTYRIWSSTTSGTIIPAATSGETFLCVLAPRPIRSRAGVEARAEVVATPANGGDRQPTHLIREVGRIVGAERTIKLRGEGGQEVDQRQWQPETEGATTMTAQAGVIVRRTSAS